MNLRVKTILIAGSFILALGLYIAYVIPHLSNRVQIFTISLAEPHISQSSPYLNPAAKTVTVSGERQIALSILSEPKFVSGDRNSVKTTDSRVIAMYNFLLDYSSPMYPYADAIVTEADKYGLDWRLVVSISGVESAFGRLIPRGSYNGWGWKGDPTRDWSHFNGWEEGITTVTSRLALGYGTNLSPFDIEATYCPPCGQNPEHAWANGVQNYMNSLNIYLAEVESN